MPPLTTFPGYAKPTTPWIDAGVLYVGSTPVALGATTGGLTFDPGITEREMDWDGKASPVAGTERVVSYDAKITGKIKGITSALLQQLYAGSTKSTAVGPPSVDTVTPIDAQQIIPGDTGYLTNVCLIHRLADDSIEQVIFPFARVMAPKFADSAGQEGSIDITIRAYLGPTETNLQKCPFTHTVTAAA